MTTIQKIQKLRNDIDALTAQYNYLETMEEDHGAINRILGELSIIIRYKLQDLNELTLATKHIFYNQTPDIQGKGEGPTERWVNKLDTELLNSYFTMLCQCNNEYSKICIVDSYQEYLRKMDPYLGDTEVLEDEMDRLLKDYLGEDFLYSNDFLSVCKQFLSSISE